mgnify:FL=1
MRNRYKLSIESESTSFIGFFVTDHPFNTLKLNIELNKRSFGVCIGEVQYEGSLLTNMEKGDVVLEYSLDNRVIVKDMNSNLSSGSSKAKPRSLDEGVTVLYTTVKQIINRT